MKEYWRKSKVGIKRWAAFMLAVCMTVTGMPVSGFASPSEKKQTMFITEVEALPDGVAVQEVPAGTTMEQLKLPGELKAKGYKLSDLDLATPSNPAAEPKTATASDPVNPEAGKPKSITIKGVTWEADRDYDPAGNPDSVGNTWSFTPVFPERYVLDENVTLPEIAVTVKDKNAAPVLFGLTPASYSIEGRVTVKDTEDGLPARVILYFAIPNSSGPVGKDIFKETTADENGYYKFEGVESQENSFYISAEYDGYQKPISWMIDPEDLRENKTGKDFEMEKITATAVTITVRKDNEIWPNSGKTYFLRSDEGKDYTDFSELPDGTYYVYQSNGGTKIATVTTDCSLQTEQEIFIDYYTVTLTAGTGIESVTDLPGPIWKGWDLRIEAETKAGYEWKEWQNTTDQSTYSKDQYTKIHVDKPYVLTAVAEKTAQAQVYVTVYKNGDGWIDHNRTLKLKDTSGNWTGQDERDLTNSNAVPFTVSAAGTYEVWEFDGDNEKAKVAEVEVKPDKLGTDEPVSVPVDYYSIKVEKTGGIESVSLKALGDQGIDTISKIGAKEWVCLPNQYLQLEAVVKDGYEWDRWEGTSIGSDNRPVAHNSGEKAYEIKMVGENRWSFTAYAKEPGYPVTIETLKDGQPWNVEKRYRLERKSAYETFYDLSSVPAGTYFVREYQNGGWEATGSEIEVKAGGENKAQVLYYTLTLRVGEGIESVEGSGIYRVNSSIPIKAKLKTGYEFDGWKYTVNNQLCLSYADATIRDFYEPHDLTAVGKKVEEARSTVRVIVGGEEDDLAGKAYVQLTDSTGVVTGPFGTNMVGFCEFTGLKPGIYTVTASCDGYKTHERRIDVSDSYSEVTIMLETGADAPVHKVTLNLYKDNEPWTNHNRWFTLEKGLHVYNNFDRIPDGEYLLCEGGMSTGIPVKVEGEDATCRADYYTVTFHDGETPYNYGAWSPQIVLKGRKIQGYSDPQKDGYEFLGWTTAHGGAESFLIETPVGKTLNLYAVWQSDNPDERYYKVTLTGDGEGSLGAGNYKAGTAVTVFAGIKANYRFDGWTSADGVVFADPAGRETTFVMPGKDVQVKASWTYLGGGGSGGGGSSSSGSENNEDTNTIHTTPSEEEQLQTGESAATATTTNSATGATVVTTVKKDSAGNVAAVTADVSDTRPSLSLDGMETRIGVSVDTAAIRAAARAARAQGLAGNAVSLNIMLPAQTMISQLSQSDGKSLQVDITIPQAVADDSSTPVTGISLSKEVQEAAMAAGKDLTVTIRDEHGSVGARWIFAGEDLKNAAAPSGDMNLAVYVKPVKVLPGEMNAMRQAAASSLGAAEPEVPGLAVSFGDAGSFPLRARVQIPAGNDAGIKPGDEVFLYRFNHTSGKLEEVPDGQYTVGEDGFATLWLSDGSDYALLPEKIERAAQAQTGQPQNRQEGGSKAHIVRAGDTIYKLAGEYGCTVNDILAVNEVADVYDLRIGREIQIPVE